LWGSRPLNRLSNSERVTSLARTEGKFREFLF
jgi:hypothetical protein